MHVGIAQIEMVL